MGFQYDSYASLTDSGCTVNSLADSGKTLGTEIANGTAKNTLSTWTLTIDPDGAAWDAGGYAELYFLKETGDGTFEDGDGGGEDPPASALAGVFLLDDRDAEQVVSLTEVPLPNCDLKPLLILEGGQAADGAGNSLKYRSYNLEDA